MSVEVMDNKIVSLQFDNKNFEANVAQSMSTLEKLQKSLKLKDASKGFEDIENAAKKIDVTPVEKQIDKIERVFNAKTAIMFSVVSRFTNRVADKIESVFRKFTIEPVKQGWDEYGLKIQSVQTILNSSGESLDEVKTKIEELNHYADKTIYSFSDMTNNIGKFTNANVPLNKATKAIQGVANVAASAGVGANEASRAMYNFSQALSIGSVKLLDWKSIENANMATNEFKTQLLETAAAMKVVTKLSDGTYKTAKGSIVTSEKLREYLNEDIISSDVLLQTLENYATDLSEMSEVEKDTWRNKMISIGYTEEQIEKIEEISKKAFDSATQVKTLKQLMDTLMEAAGSGWAETWEIVFGDLEEAKALWTGVNNVISPILDNISEFRNNLLKTWKMMGGRTQMIRAFSQAWKDLNMAIMPLKDGFRMVFPKITADNLVNFSYALRKFMEEIKPTWKALTGIRRITTGLSSVLKGILTIIGKVFGILWRGAVVVDVIVNSILEFIGSAKSLNDALSKLFGNAWISVLTVAESVISKMSDAFEKAKNKVRDFVQKTQILEKLLLVIIAPIILIKNALVAIATFVINIISRINIANIISSIAGFLGKIKDVLVLIKDIFAVLIQKIGQIQIVKNIINWLSVGLSKISDILFFIARRVGTIIDAVRNFKISDVVSKLSEFLERIKGSDLFSGNGNLFKSDGISNFVSNIVNGFKTLGSKLANNPIVGYLKNMLTYMVQVFSGVKKEFKGLMNSFGDFAKQFDIKTLLVVAGIISFVSLVVKMNRALGAAQSVLVGLKKTLNIINLTLTTVQNRFLASSTMANILAIAAAIGVLAISLKILAEVPQDELQHSAIVFAQVSVVLGALAGGLYLLMSKLDGGKSTLVGVIAMSAAIGLMVVAFNSLKEVDISETIYRLTVLGSMAVIVGGITALLAKFAPSMASGALSILAVSASMLILAKAIQNVTNMGDMDAIASNASAMCRVLVSFSVVMFAMRGIKLGAGLGLLGMVASISLLIKLVRDFSSSGVTTQKVLDFRSFLNSFSTVFIAYFALSAISRTNASGFALATAMISFAFTTEILVKRVLPALTEIAKIDTGLLNKARNLFAVIFASLAAMTAASSLFSLAGGKGGIQLSIILLAYAGVLSIITKRIVPSVIELTKTDRDAYDKAATVVGAMSLVMAAIVGIGAIGKRGAIGAGIVLGAYAGVMYLITTVITPAVEAMSQSTLFKMIALVGTITVATGAIMVLSSKCMAAVGAKSGLIIAAGVILAFGGVVYALSTMPDYKTALAGCVGIAMVVGATIALMYSIKATSVGALSALGSLIPIALVVGALGELTITLSNKIGDAEKALAGLIGIAGVILAIAGVIKILQAVDFVAAIKAAGSIVVFAAILIAGIALIAEGLAWLGSTVTDEQMANLTKVGEFLAAAGSAIGGFFGGIVGAFTAEVLNETGQALTDFAITANPFFVWVQKFNGDLLESVGCFSACMLLIGASELIAAIAAIGGSQIVEMFDQLKQVDFSFFKSLSTVDDTLITKAENLKTVIQNITSAEWSSFWGNLANMLGGNGATGDLNKSSLNKTMDVLSGFVTDFVGKFSELSNNDFNRATLAFNIVDTIVKAADSVSEIKKLGTVENDLESLGKGLWSFNTHLNTLDDRTIQNTNRAVYVMNALSGVHLNNSGGVLGWIMGDNDLDDFGNQLDDLATGLVDYSTKLEEMKGSSIIGNNGIACTVIETLGTAAKSIPNSGGLLGDILGNNDLDTFASGLGTVGVGIANYTNALASMNPNGVSKSEDAVKILENLIAASNVMARDGSNFSALWGAFEFKGAEAPKLGDFMKEITPLLDGLKEFVAAFDGSSEDGINSGNLNMAIINIDKIADMCERLADADGWKMEQFGENLWGLAQTGLSSFINVWKDEDNATMLGAVQMFVTNLFSAIDTEFLAQYETLQEIGNTAGLAIIESIMDQIDVYDWKSHGVTIGMYFAQGITQGFGMMQASLSLASVQMGDAVEGGIRTRLDENSPSKVGIDIGKWFGISLGMGIEQGTKSAADASTELGAVTEESLRDRIQVHSLSPLFEKIGGWIPTSVTEGINAGKNFVMNAMSSLGGGAVGSFIGSIRDKIKAVEDEWNSGKGLVEIVKDALGIEDAAEAAEIAEGIEDVAGSGGSAIEAVKKILTDMEAASKYKFGGEIAKSYYENFKQLGITMADAEHDVGLFVNYLLDKSGYTLKELDKDKDAAEAMAEQTEDYLQNLQKAFEDFYKKVDDKITGFDWFSEFDEQTMLGTDIIENLTERKEAMENWVDTLSELRNKGISEDLYQILLDKGPDGEGFAMAMAMADASDEEFEEMNSLYAEILSMQKGWTNQIIDNAVALGQNVALGFAQGVNEAEDPIAQSSYNIANSALNGVRNYEGIDSSSVSKVGQTLCTGLASGIDDNIALDISSVDNLSDSVIKALNNGINAETGNQIGKYLTEGLGEGLLDEEAFAELMSRAEFLAMSVKNKIEEVTEVHSPSKMFARTGRFLTLGLAEGMYSGENEIQTASEQMAIKTTSYLQNTMSRLSDMVNGELQSPVIRPTLDLSNVQANASRINSMMGGNSIGVDINGQSGNSAVGGMNFIQNNYSPKALSREEIYRQTKKQFAFVKEVIANT